MCIKTGNLKVSCDIQVVRSMGSSNHSIPVSCGLIH